ncbi:hypothetical protein NJB14197_15100 [Mycobacterium montefiorense]|uniref:Uncharacterized protein n=1 Tax=Mycobacterium montefiorense TaxID=154654 RepID=A0AA37PL96_9MYCO|nr:hypothetical protein MmonteBS_43520 [Mycobacterium montefiorense]GKU33661.1 hypothetical protein NJB14191_10080 [Mycobacterium montefiorense]GKU39597.1 hypothetical protein NJB14192_15900 [Mycobacterium montefiorense]GKU43874.1 hypothetical protein NJB14194_05070 [Mycobacterium montefiorense]GKU52634.1 hypothetical protein NJB14195_38760 [Mycobacterium montefiorense]
MGFACGRRRGRAALRDDAILISVIWWHRCHSTNVRSLCRRGAVPLIWLAEWELEEQDVECHDETLESVPTALGFVCPNRN